MQLDQLGLLQDADFGLPASLFPAFKSGLQVRPSSPAFKSGL
jgi:hypothetical protein